MNKFDKLPIIKKALATYGLDHQIDKMIEELGELLQATIKLRQSTKTGIISVESVKSSIYFTSFIEELADVDVLKDQILYAFDMERENSLFNKIKQQKYIRLDYRLSQTNLDEFY